MSKGSKYLLVSLPTSISPSSHPDEALTALRSTITTDCGTTYPFSIPTFKIGTLDALVQQADDLAKLESACEGVVNKVGDSLKTILDGDEGKAQQNKTINDSTHTASNSRMVIPGETDSVGRARRPVPADFSVEQDQIPGR
jgi:V-type H+-transporting ATPase subunit C